MIPAGQASVTVTLHSLVNADRKGHKRKQATIVLKKGFGYKRGSANKANVHITE
jgi:hypothetical protein